MTVVVYFYRKSKKISNDQELIQSDPISCPQNQKEIKNYFEILGYIPGLLNGLEYLRRTGDFSLFMPYANNKGADQPAHPRSLISAFVFRCQDSKIPLHAIAEISSL